ncbi:MAG TPA: stalk domain-containing protein [Caldisericia bacterium]|nr:stalk domain-containing protein [Caldisericia bacterium]HQL66107.1 stalk domain-containing protein [Caldisericia bacterium]
MKKVWVVLIIILMFTGYFKATEAVPDFDCDYLILIPQQTKDDFDNSTLTGLRDFIEAKEESGFKVKVETVANIENNLAGRDRAEKIRNYLKEMYFTGGKKLKYVLLIGDVGQYWYYRDQSDGDMPLRLVFPDDSRRDWEEGRDYIIGPRTYCDLYYANLTLDWDRDMDGYFEKDDIDYGIPEVNVLVGRIPFSSREIVDKILRQIIDYKNRDEAKTKSILFADANRFIFKETNDLATFAYLSQKFASQYRNENLNIVTMFEKEGDAIPLVESDLPLTEENLIQEMLKEYDVVHLSGYESEFPIGAPRRMIWIDLNKNGVLDNYFEAERIPLFTISDLHTLREMQSVVVVPVGDSAELSMDGFTKLLLNLTRSPAVIGYNSWIPLSQPKIDKLGKFDIGFIEKLIQGLSIGEAFYQTYLDFRSDPVDVMGALPHLLGDPSLVVFPLESSKIIVPEELDLGYEQERFLEIQNQGGKDLVWTITESSPWIMLEKTEGSIKSKCNESIKINLDYTKMNSGENVGIIVFDSNGGQAKVFVKAIKDDIPPQIILEAINPIVNSKIITIKGEVIDSLSGIQTITINSEIVILQENSFEKEITLEEGENEVLIIAIDKVGNKAEMKIIIECDTIPPEIVCSIPEKVYNEFFTIEGSVKDKNIIKSLTVNKREIVLKENTFQLTLPLAEGNNIVVIEAEDIAGNKTTRSFSIEYIKRTILKLQIGNKTMYVNDNSQEIDVPPIIIEGRTLLPIRWVAEPLGAEVGWDGVERKVTITLKNTTIELWIDKNIARVNGIDTLIDPTNPKVVPIIKDGRTMLPVRFVAENLGCKVDWDQDTKTVTITYPKD